jgi:signal peptidase I
MNIKNNWFTELIRTLSSALVLVLVVHTILIKPFSIPSGSMVPTFLIGDYLFVSKFTYGYSRYSIPFSPNLFSGRILASEPNTGDVVVFRPPHKTYEDWIKRVIGRPGDRIRMIEGILHINDKPVTLEKVGKYDWYDQYNNFDESELYMETLPNGVKHQILKSKPFGKHEKDNTPEFLVPEGHYFMMGDNRDNSEDSRYSRVGFIPFENLVGRAELIFFSTDLPTQNGAWWMVWRWPTATRYSRFFTIVR